MCMNIDSGGYSEANSWYFLFMEQMHWQFISYSCSFPSGIHLYKLERCIGCPLMSAHHMALIAVIVSQFILHHHHNVLLRKRIATVPSFLRAEKGPGGLELVPPCLKKFIPAL